MEISPQDLKRRLVAGEAIEVVDIREAAEYGDWHIFGSRNLPVFEALKVNRTDELVAGLADLSPDRAVVTVCRAGVMARRAAEVLRSVGREAFSLSGGIRGWGGVWTEAEIVLEGKSDVTLMQIRRNGKGCLSYLLGHQGQAVIVDPCVDVKAYLDAAESRGLVIGHVLETHVHADHLSRARELCVAAGAKLVMPDNRRVNFPYVALRDGDTLRVGAIEIEAIDTPGHTTESTSYLVDGQLLLTGDTLFPDSVGRPDLEKGNPGAEKGARALYRSLHERLLGRFADVPFYPAHCADPIGFDGLPIGGTTGAVFSSVDLLRAGEDAFVSRIIGSLTEKPANFESVIAVNEGRAGLEGIDPLDLEAGPNRCAAG